MNYYSKIVDFLEDNRQCLTHNNFDGLFEAYIKDASFEVYFGEVIDFFLNELKINILNYFSRIPSYEMFFGSQATSLDFSKNTKITEIPNNCFRNLRNLTSVNLPPNITSIGKTSFYELDKLSSITIPLSVTNIGEYAFGCSRLTSITIPGSVTSISEGTFWDCQFLNNINIQDGVTSIGNWAFKYCVSLTSITLPDSITRIGPLAFSGCTKLTSITIPESVTYIGESAFFGCPDDLVIYTKAGSYAEQYAKENNLNVVTT